MRAIWICHRTQSKLWEYIEGRLSVAEMGRVTLHLERCAACLSELERARMIVPAILAQRLQAVPASEADFADIVRRIEMERIFGRRTRQRRRGMRGVPFAVAAVGALFLILRIHVILTSQIRNVPRPGAQVFHPTTRYPEKVPQLVWADRGMAAGYAVHPNRHVRANRALTPRREVGINVSKSPGHERLAMARHSRSFMTLARLSHIKRRAITVALKPGSVETEADTDKTNVKLLGWLKIVHAREPAGDDARQPDRAFIMQTIRQDEDVQRTFVMDNIPMTTLAGTAGTSAANAQNPETGKAL